VPRLTLAELVHGTQGALVGGRLDTAVTGMSIDSRTCRPGDAFFAIRGAHQDGHAFVGHARMRGAACAVTTRIPAGLGAEGDFPVVLVDDTTAALQRLGAAHRRRFAIPVVAVTAFAMKGDEQRIREGGCEAYLSKPISIGKFIETIRHFLGSA